MWEQVCLAHVIEDTAILNTKWFFSLPIAWSEQHKGVHKEAKLQLRVCTCSCWGNFLHGSPTDMGAMLWICQLSVDNTEVFSLLLSRACTVKPFLFLTPCHQWAAWECTRSWEETQPGQLIPTHPRDIPYHMASVQYIELEKEGEKGGHLDWWCLSSQGVVIDDGAWLYQWWLTIVSSEVLGFIIKGIN